MVVSHGSLPNSDSQERSTDPFVDFYRLHYPGAVRLAWLLTHDHSVTDDVVQDAFLHIRPRFDTVLDGQAYLRACVVNGCRARARSSQRSTARLRLVSATMLSSVRIIRRSCSTQSQHFHTTNAQQWCFAIGPICPKPRSPASSPYAQAPFGHWSAVHCQLSERTSRNDHRSRRTTAHRVGAGR